MILKVNLKMILKMNLLYYVNKTILNVILKANAFAKMMKMFLKNFGKNTQKINPL